MLFRHIKELNLNINYTQDNIKLVKNNPLFIKDYSFPERNEGEMKNRQKK